VDSILSDELYIQRDQPDGVPPLELTGERTLPDVPQENYWFRRHLAVYEWIRARVGGMRVVDMACGEGYGSDELAGTARHVVGVDANPEAHEHARLRYVRDNLRFERALVEDYSEECDAIVFLQTIEHLRNPDAVIEHFKSMLAGGRRDAVYVSTPNVLTLAGADAQHSGNPWHVREYLADEFRELCGRHFASVEIHGVYPAGRLALHELALERLSWDAVHRKLGITKVFYDRFLPSITTADFALRLDRRLDEALDFVAVCRP
jgi:SAM-dependent methyltransferase